jgi:hypothetical protein
LLTVLIHVQFHWYWGLVVYLFAIFLTLLRISISARILIYVWVRVQIVFLILFILLSSFILNVKSLWYLYVGWSGMTPFLHKYNIWFPLCREIVGDTFFNGKILATIRLMVSLLLEIQVWIVFIIQSNSLLYKLCKLCPLSSSYSF